MMTRVPSSHTMDQKWSKVSRFGHIVATNHGASSPKLSIGDALMYSTERSGSIASTYGPMLPPKRLRGWQTVGLWGPL